MSDAQQSILVIVDRLTALLVEWPLADIRRLLRSCEIETPDGAPPGNGSRRWLISTSLRSLDSSETVDRVRLEKLCGVVIETAVKRVSPRKTPAARRSAKKLRDLEAVLRSAANQRRSRAAERRKPSR